MNFPIFSLEFNCGRSAKAANPLFVGFLKNENSLESFSLIFENSSPKGFSWQNMKKSDSSVLEANSRYLESPFLKMSATTLGLRLIKNSARWILPSAFCSKASACSSVNVLLPLSAITSETS